MIGEGKEHHFVNGIEFEQIKILWQDIKLLDRSVFSWISDIRLHIDNMSYEFLSCVDWLLLKTQAQIARLDARIRRVEVSMEKIGVSILYLTQRYDSVQDVTKSAAPEGFYLTRTILFAMSTKTTASGKHGLQSPRTNNHMRGHAILQVAPKQLGFRMSGGYGPVKPDEEMIKVIYHAVSVGVTHFDTSDVYGPHANEILLGKVKIFLGFL
ncbi:auxin-induced protein PCNT115-like protein [Tanacetum coccineum]